MSQVVSRRSYQTTDGCLHTNKLTAQTHQASLNITKLIEARAGSDRGLAGWEIFELIDKNVAAFQAYLNPSLVTVVDGDSPQESQNA